MRDGSTIKLLTEVSKASSGSVTSSTRTRREVVRERWAESAMFEDSMERVGLKLGISLTPCTVKKFSDNETSVSIGESVREEDVFILQTGFNPSPYPFGAKARHYGNGGDNPEVSRPGTPLPPLASSADLKNRPSTPSKPAPAPANDPNDLLMELLIMISACKTASAKRITAVVPCFPYSRMDRKDKSRSPITAKLVANMLQIAGCDHVITMDLHASQIQGFFEVPVDNLWTEPSMIRCASLVLSLHAQEEKKLTAMRESRWVKENIQDWKEVIIVSPDAGGAKRATNLADRLDVDFALINRNRSKGDGPESEGKMELLVGDVKDKVAILIDDMCDTGGTIKLATTALVEKGAKEVYALVSHGLLSGESMAELAKLPLVKLVVSNTISQAEHLKQAHGKLEIMDISPVLAESIRRTHNGESISLLFS
ncbi:SPOSA6832_00381, partial [Sporobolomyces salmonicolor]